ncbi:MAG: hypothetical protein N2234_02160 [Planctomycetota bacterium]|nr:hypothetical protein [Planctomycetota bacterium]
MAIKARWFKSGDESQIRALFERVFKKEKKNHVVLGIAPKYDYVD